MDFSKYIPDVPSIESVTGAFGKIEDTVSGAVSGATEYVSDKVGNVIEPYLTRAAFIGVGFALLIAGLFALSHGPAIAASIVKDKIAGAAL